jgi:excisionase family DNA binding protein
MLKGFMTSIQAAQMLNITPQRIRILASEGRFPGAEKTGRDWLIPEAAVKAFTRRVGGRGREPKGGRQ